MQRPCLKPHIAVLRDGDHECCLIGGERELFRCRGRSVPFLLDDLLPLLDGTRTVGELTSALRTAAPDGAVSSAIELLVKNRLLVDCGPPELDLSVLRRSTAWPLLCRTSDRPAELARALSGARVVILGDDPVADSVAQQLRSCGLGAVDRLPGLDGSQDELAPRLLGELQGAGLIVAVQNGEFAHRPALLALNRLARQERLAWLQLRLTLDGEGWLGPLYTHHGPCFECFERRLASNLKSSRESASYREQLRDGAAPRRLGFAPFEVQLASMAVTEVLKHLTAFEPSALHGACRVVDLVTQESSLHTLLKFPNCPACGPELVGACYPWQEDEVRLERQPLLTAAAPCPETFA